MTLHKLFIIITISLFLFVVDDSIVDIFLVLLLLLLLSGFHSWLLVFLSCQGLNHVP